MAYLPLPRLSYSATLVFLLLLFCFLSLDAQQLPNSQSMTLHRLPRLLEYPAALAGWSRATAFCSLPPSRTLSILCSSNRIVELVIVGDRHSKALSPSFSSASLFTTLTRFPNLTTLSLVALGLWGRLPGKVHRFPSLKVLNLSSNYFAGEIPMEISSMLTLQNLVLAGNSFNGSLPDLKALVALQELDVSGNRLGPEFPSLSNGLVTLILRNNVFCGTIVANFTAFHQLRKLDLSSNRLSGWIPPSLFSLPSIRFLDLSNNAITGQIPGNVSCSSSLGFINIANNLLFGGLPRCMLFNSSSRVVLSSGNCLNAGDPRYQHRVEYCDSAALAAVVPPTNKISGSRSYVNAIFGITGGIIVGAALMGLLIFVVFRRSKAVILHKLMASKSSVADNSSRRTIDTRHISEAARIETLGLAPYRMFSIKELEEATNKFHPSNQTENSSRGQFYKGLLGDGSMVIVKRMQLNPKFSVQNLPQYLELISKLRHRHLASMLGHCIISSQDDVNTTTIIYFVSERVTNGTLRSHLTEWRKREMLKWPQRLAAITGIARGIQFLHTVTVPGIFGNNLDMENILLDKTLTAKINNYSFPILLKNKNSKIANERTFASVDHREMGSIHSVANAERQDIYQLGCILLEVITGKPNATKIEVDTVRSKPHKDSTDSPLYVKEIVVDPTIRGTFALDSIRTVIEISLKCVSEDLNQRPSIDDVLWNLQYASQIQDGWASSENLSIQE
ncbi:putative LRR receptor-like serine/threonine-protein kinase At1g14390 [Curcuma longa]|uniref:putative LRR receptor-like serine/threonine-protein kinase At1g14390 n=1 Tax=Curcuma longa TaxID=136217 RepID=UPI003D9FA14F